MKRSEIKDKAQRRLLGMISDGLMAVGEENEDARKRGDEPPHEPEIVAEITRQAARLARSWDFVSFGGILRDGVAIDYDGNPLEKKKGQ